MLLIADSGSTKTAWSLFDAKKPRAFRTHGLNPYFLDRENVVRILKEDLLSRKAAWQKVDRIYFYGAGCNSKGKNQIIRDGLRNAFPKAKIEVHSDLLGAARGLCGKDPGILAILGTGSNCCYYDGKNTFQENPSLGFILGDEGGGADLGKRFLRAVLYRQLPARLLNEFDRSFRLSKEHILDAVYKKEFPNRFLASFVPFLKLHQRNPLIRKILIESFGDFFKQHVMKYKKYSPAPLNFAGSVAFVFKDVLQEVAEENYQRAKSIVQDPLPGLLNYHSADRR